jgi:SAM-dependent methyltransferase
MAENTIDWANLSSMLSADSLTALQSHMNDKEVVTSSAQNSCEVPVTDDHLRLSVDNTVFKDQNYWEERFTEEEEYDWLLSYDQLKTQLSSLLKLDDRILIIGCGNSTLSAKLYDDGFKNITNMDFSEIVIAKMIALHGIDRPTMKWITMDVTDMIFKPNSFEVVLDKACMDALIVDEGDIWNPNPPTIKVADEMCRGISKVLVPSGKHIQLSFAQPHFRTKYLMGLYLKDELYDTSSIQTSQFESAIGFCKRYDWTLSFSTVETEAGCLNSFIYVMELQ